MSVATIIRAGLNKAVQAGKVAAERAQRAVRFIDGTIRAAWKFLSNVPERISLKADDAKISSWHRALSFAQIAQVNNFSPKQAKEMLQKRNPALYEEIKDYFDAARKALKAYPRWGDENMLEDENGGGSNESIRTTREPNQSNSGRGNENGVEGEPVASDGSSQNPSEGNNPQAGNGEQGAEGVSGGRTNGGKDVSGSGTATGGTRGNQQGGQKTSDA